MVDEGKGISLNQSIVAKYLFDTGYLKYIFMPVKTEEQVIKIAGDSMAELPSKKHFQIQMELKAYANLCLDRNY